MSAEVEVVELPTKADVAQRAAERLVAELVPLTASENVAHVALTGGSLGIATLEAIADLPERADVAWSRVHLWWSDERFVPRADSERNSRQARAALLDALDLPDVNVHEPWATEDGTLDDAARAYADELAAHAAEGAQAPAFDVCLLGMGPDAHVASLFPGRDEVHVTGATVLPVRNSPKPPPERVTFTLPVINASARVWLVVSGADKAEAVAKVRSGADAADAPAAAVRGTAETVMFVARDAL
ncbi:6-phosphogluconolactonase [Microbacterium excoecariae]|uniref:6-phosphogluconolactonase n=1 Tax=Microbacterium excoecariae TaxID=2715210 RepID=UPI00140B9C35|nr:6-phosphogluconolactonase [Microbacterium excoecariae]